MLPDAERFRLLHGPSAAPPRLSGDRTTCLIRDAEVVVTGWNNAPIAWPQAVSMAKAEGMWK